MIWNKNLFSLLLVVGYVFFSIPVSAEVTISGSSTVHPIVKKAMNVFKKQTGIDVQAKGGGSSVGINEAINGRANIGMVSRVLTSEEQKHLDTHTIAQDGIAVIVNTANPISGLSHSEVVKIFSGEITNWETLNGFDKDITLIAKEEGRSTKLLFEEYFSLAGKMPSSARLIGSNAEDIMFVASDPYAIGYVSIGSAETANKQGIYIKPVQLDEVDASIANVANRTYLLRRPLNLVTRDSPQDDTKRFIEFILSKQGQELVKSMGFIPVNE